MKAAGKMVMESNSKNPPAEYTIGSEVMVRRFSSKCRKRAGTQSASKTSRIVKGTITEINKKCGTYRILCKLESGHIEEWFKVSDITSLTYEEEKTKHNITKMEIAEDPENSPLGPTCTHKPDQENNTSPPLHDTRGGV